MASASSTSARHLFGDSKRRLGERVHVNVASCASVCRQLVRGSHSADLLTRAAKHTALLDSTIDNSADNVQKLQVLVTHLSYQQEAIQRHSAALPHISQQVQAMQQPRTG